MPPARAASIKRITRAPEPARLPRRRAAHPHRTREDAVVLPALRAAPAGGRRDGALRPQLVQPRRRRARHGLLHRRGVRGVPALLPGVRAHAGALGHHPDQVLVLGQRRRAGAPFPGRIDDPTKRWKLSPMDLQSRARWVEYSKAKDEMFASHRHQAGALVRGQRRQQTPRASERHPAPALR